MSEKISMRQFLEAGAHFGHQTRRWDPKMKPYIFGERNGIHIIDLQKTVGLLKNAVEFVEKEVARGKTVLFVGTKRQAQHIVAEQAVRCNMGYMNYRWLGGTLTNFQTIKKTVRRLQKIEEMKKDGTVDLLPKKERIKLDRDLEKLERTLGGIKGLKKIPEIMFIVDPKQEHIAKKEAQCLGMKVVSVVDTNCSPEGVDFLIPGNDDSIRSIELFTSAIADACIRGAENMQVVEEKQDDQESKGGPAIKKIRKDVADVKMNDNAGIAPE